MRGVMRQIGDAPGLLSRLPGMKQLAQLRKLKGQGLEDVLGKDAAGMERAMGGGIDPARLSAEMAGLPKGYTPPMPAGALARARLMGYAPEPIGNVETEAERERRKKKRKQERQNKKKARKGRKK